MKVIALNGSPKKEGNTKQALDLVLKQLEAENIDTEVIQVGSKAIRGCIACNMCAKNKDEKCVLPDDGTNEIIQQMKNADGILIGTPVHYSGMSATLKDLLDRAFYVGGNNGNLFRHKVGASIAAVRRSGGMPAFTQMNNYINYSEMIMPTSNYWNVIHGTRPGDIHQDLEGVQIMEVLGQNMAWIMKVIDQSDIAPPSLVRKKFTNFVR